MRLAILLLALGAAQGDSIQELLKLAPLPKPAERPVAAKPPDDATGEVLLRYRARFPIKGAGSAVEAVRQRLLEACDAQPDYLPEVLAQLPQTDAARARVRAIFEREQKNPKLSERWRKEVRQYLVRNTRFYLEELIATARVGKDEEDLKALAAVDWASAEPVLKAHAAGPNRRVAAVAMALLWAHFGTAAYRQPLQRLVEDRKAPGRARDIAAEALLESQWDGRDAWYWGLFADPTLLELREEYLVMTPLSHIRMPEEEWIRGLAARVGSKDRAVHDAAVSCLVGFQLDSARRDALLPLLPWLKDPKWSSAGDRLRLIQSMDRVEMPEAVPGLIAVLDQESEYDRSYAAESLEHYHPAEAVPALRRALAKETDWQHRRRIVKALVACGGVSEEEAARAVEALARQVATPKGEEELSRASYSSEVKLPAEVALGEFLAGADPPAEGVTVRLLARVSELQAGEPAVAKALQRVVERWPSRKGDLDVFGRIAAGRADAQTIRAALERRESLRKTLGPELRSAAAGGGVAAGVVGGGAGGRSADGADSGGGG